MVMWENFKRNDSLRRFSVFLVICLGLYFIREAISMILLTFIFTFLILRLVKSVQRWVKIPQTLIVIVTYAVIVSLFYFTLTHYVPKLIYQTGQMIESVYRFYQSPARSSMIVEWIGQNIDATEIKDQLKNGLSLALTYLTSIGSMGATFLLSFILSFFFSIEEKRVREFSRLFFTSKIGWFSQDVAYLGGKFVETFGVVLEAQFLIALANTVITTIGLYFLGLPQLVSLSIMIFILSLIPVAGVIISCIPLALIGYSIGGFTDVVYILGMIAIVHALESYVLNPKLMSSKTELPVFFTFVILLFSERFFGVWGLIVGIPIFVFLLDLLDVKAIRKKIGTKKEEKTSPTI